MHYSSPAGLIFGDAEIHPPLSLLFLFFVHSNEFLFRELDLVSTLESESFILYSTILGLGNNRRENTSVLDSISLVVSSQTTSLEFFLLYDKALINSKIKVTILIAPDFTVKMYICCLIDF